jgi:hypothetical protein
MNKFDKPYRVLPTYDIKKAIELFNLASKLDTHELLQFSLINQIPLDVVNDNDECLIHEVISIDMRIATQHSKLNVIKFLVQNGVNPDKPNKYNKTPLHLACSLQLDHIVEYLLSIGVNPNFQDNIGYSAMHYHLTGYIKTLARDNEVIDFISTINPMKQNTDMVNDIMEIKKLIWDLIDKRDGSNNLPIFNTINETLDNILTEDSDIVEKQNKLIETIQNLSTKSDGDILPAITAEINAAKSTIRNKINNMFNNLTLSNNFVSYDSNDSLSWAPSTMPTKTVIKNGNIRRVIKNDMEKMIDTIETLNKFKENNVDMNYVENGFNGIYEENIYPILKNKNMIARLPGGAANQLHFNRDITNLNNDINNINNMIRHHNAIDNASSIIDFNSLQYMGGSRIIMPMIPKDMAGKPLFLEELQSIIKLDNIDKQILCLLGLPINEISKLPLNYKFDYNNLANIFNIDVNITCTNNANELQDTIFTNYLYDMNGNVKILNSGMPSDLMLITEFKYYIIFAGIALLNPVNFSKLNRLDILNSVPNFNGNVYANKWYNLYMKYPDIRQWLFGMWSDLTCKMSNSNLEGSIHTRTLMLIGSIDTKSSNMLQNVINMYKPQIIYKMKTDTIVKLIITLLNDDINNIFIDSILDTSPFDTRINSLIIPSKLKEIGQIVDIYINKKSEILDNIIYKKYAKTNKSPIDNLCKIILDYYNNDMKYKPLKQTMLDTIYLLRNHTNVTEFINIMTPIDVNSSKFTTMNPFTMTSIIQPSFNSFYNYWLSKDPNDTTNINKYHLITSHYMGLHYMGLLYNIEFNLNDPIIINDKGKKELYTVLDNTNTPSLYHTVNGGGIDNNMLPLPLNYLHLDNTVFGQVLSDNDKNTYYSLIDNMYRMPSYQSYCMTLIIRIRQIQMEIVDKLQSNKKIIDQIKKGETHNIKRIYSDIYPKLVTFCRIIEYFKNEMTTLNSETIDKTTRQLLNKYKKINTFDYNSMATMLNGINSNYYLYYYLFSPEKLLKLSKFNYYMLPIYKASSYLFYNNDTSDNVNIIEEDTTFIAGTNKTAITDNDINSGIINNMNNYNNMLNEYNSGILPISSSIESKQYFKRLKQSRLPPALYSSLDKFYNYSLIEIIKKIIEYVDSNKKDSTNRASDIYNKVEELVKKTLIISSNTELAVYNVICKIIEELIKEQINVYIDNAVIKYYNKFYVNMNVSKLKENTLFVLKDMTVSLNTTKIDLSKIKKKQLHNLYSPIMKLPSDEANVFILYPNDLSNMNKLRIKYGLHINNNIIKILLNNNASPFIYSSEGTTPIYPIIKNYNYMLVEELKNLGIDFREYEREMPIEFIKTENTNNINKIINTDISLNNIILNTLLSNIDGNLYFDAKAKIISNEIFGNNILLYLPESFNICSYLTLQYLSEHLLNTNTEFTIVNATDIIDLLNINIADVNKNYLVTNIDSFNVPNNINTLIAIELLKDKTKEFEKINDDYNKLKVTKDELASDPAKHFLSQKIENSENFKKLKKCVESLSDSIKQLTKLSKGQKIAISTIPNNDNIIERYESLGSANTGLIIWAWSELIKRNINLNPNLIPLYMLEKQKKYFKDFKNVEDIKKIIKGFKHLAKLGETYFETNKFTDINPFLVFIEELLNYMTKMVIGNGIEMMMRRILLTYFTSIDPTKNYINTSYRIDQIMDSTEAGKTQTLHDILYEKICPLLVKNSVEIFANRTEEEASYKMQVREILTNYFKLLENTGITLNQDVMKIFNKDVVTYFDTFTSRTISLWYVNIENILKYFINNYRCLETYNKLTGNSLS